MRHVRAGQGGGGFCPAVPEPERAVIGLKNHGLTITGTSLEDIFERIEGRILRQVPMS